MRRCLSLGHVIRHAFRVVRYEAQYRTDESDEVGPLQLLFQDLMINTTINKHVSGQGVHGTYIQM